MLQRVSRAFTTGNRITLRSFSSSAIIRRPLDMEKVDTSDRIKRLRDLMGKHKVDIYSMRLLFVIEQKC